MANSLDFLTVAEVLDLPQPKWLIKDIILEGTFAQVHGKESSGKTFLALNWALSIAAGIDWAEGRPVRQGNVIYIAGEGVSGLSKRVRAWLSHRGLEPSVFKDSVRFVPQAVQLREQDEIEMLLEGIRQTFPDGQVALIVVDTLSRSMVGVEENKAQEMSPVVAAINQLQQATGAAVMVQHHEPYEATRGRGSTVLPGALDTSIGIKKKGGSVTLTCTKQKDAEPFANLRVELEPCEESLVTTTVIETELEEVPGSGAKETVLKTLVQAKTGLSYSEWLDRCGKSKSIFNKALTALKKEGSVVQVGKVYYQKFGAGARPNSSGAVVPSL